MRSAAGVKPLRVAYERDFAVWLTFEGDKIIRTAVLPGGAPRRGTHDLRTLRSQRLPGTFGPAQQRKEQTLPKAADERAAACLRRVVRCSRIRGSDAAGSSGYGTEPRDALARVADARGLGCPQMPEQRLAILGWTRSQQSFGAAREVTWTSERGRSGFFRYAS